MPRYHYLALDIDGRERSGGIDAADEASARAALEKRKLLPVELAAQEAREARRVTRGASAPRGGGTMPRRALVLFTRQLATLVDAAVPVDEALAMIAAQQDQAGVRRVIEGVREGVLEGMRLADAMGRHPKAFSTLYRGAVAGGERSGKLGFVLTRLADYLGRTHAMRTKVQAAMIYPAALSCVAFMVVCCLMIFVVPSLTEQFQSFDAQLPLLTQILIGVSNFLAAYWALLLIALAALGLWIAALMRREAVRLRFDRAFLDAPLIGRWARDVVASRFVRAVATLVSAGLPVLDGVRGAQEAVANRAAAKAAGEIADRIEEGEPLSQGMRRAGIFPPIVVYMAASGENAGDLAGMLDKAADHLDQEIEAATTSAISLLEPAIIVFMGVVVASIVLAIMLPVLQLNQLAGA
jgi:general secretion pathway protein F